MNKVAIYLISDGIGGAEQVVRQTIKGLSGYNSIFLIVNNEIAAFYNLLLPDSRILNIGDIFLHSNKKFRIIRYLLNNRFYSFVPWIILSKSRKINNYLIDNDIDILHSHLDYALYSSLYIKKFNKKIKIFYTVHGAFGLVEDKLLKPSLALSLIDFNSIDKLIFVSHYMSNLYKAKKIPINEFEIIYNGIDYPDNSIYSREIKTNKEFKILYVGGSKYVKGYDILVETIDLLCKSNFENKFHVVVLGPLSANCEFISMIRQRKLEKHFKLIGFISPPEHLNYFKSADMLFMPSRSEALPIAAIEAISFDLPVIASNVGGLPEVITDRFNGLLANLDATEFVSKIKELFENYDKYISIGHEINKEFFKKFDAVNMCNKYLDLYENPINH